MRVLQKKLTSENKQFATTQPNHPYVLTRTTTLGHHDKTKLNHGHKTNF